MKAFITAAVLFGIAIFLFNLGTIPSTDYNFVIILLIGIMFFGGVMGLFNTDSGPFIIATMLIIASTGSLGLSVWFTGLKFFDFNTLRFVSSYVLIGCSVSIIHGYIHFHTRYNAIMNDTTYYISDFKRRNGFKSFDSKNYQQFINDVNETCHPRDSFPNIFCWPGIVISYILKSIYHSYTLIRSINTSRIQQSYRKVIRSLYQ